MYAGADYEKAGHCGNGKFHMAQTLGYAAVTVIRSSRFRSPTRVPHDKPNRLTLTTTRLIGASNWRERFSIGFAPYPGSPWMRLATVPAAALYPFDCPGMK